MSYNMSQECQECHAGLRTGVYLRFSNCGNIYANHVGRGIVGCVAVKTVSQESQKIDDTHNILVFIFSCSGFRIRP